MSTLVDVGNIASILLGKTRNSVLELLFLRDGESFYLRQIVREAGLGHGAVQRELARLVSAGLIIRTKRGREVYYQVNHESPVFSEIRSLMLKTAGLKQSYEMTGEERKVVELPKKIIKELCKRHHIRKLSVFGSALRGESTPESDLDLLVEFEPGSVPGFKFFQIEAEFSEALGRKVDLNTPDFLSRYFRDQVVNEAVVVYGSKS